MKYGLGSLMLAGGLVLSFGVAYADVLMLTSSAIADNGTLAIKNACSDKQRSPKGPSRDKRAIWAMRMW